jgi:hypothetical protein
MTPAVILAPKAQRIPHAATVAAGILLLANSQGENDKEKDKDYEKRHWFGRIPLIK